MKRKIKKEQMEKEETMVSKWRDGNRASWIREKTKVEDVLMRYDIKRLEARIMN